MWVVFYNKLSWFVPEHSFMILPRAQDIRLLVFVTISTKDTD